MTIEDDGIVGPDGLESNFDSQAYLWDFYQCIDDPAMQMMIMLLPTIAERIDCYDNLLDFGAGPTIHVSVVFRNKVNNQISSFNKVGNYILSSIISISNYPDINFLFPPLLSYRYSG
ncbi:hypothetical protein LOAG_14929 [Loa loa]|uniref:Uncharacterized protein n=1 Tax=Loa loa TaxID=7209 RepID=A0A1S0TGU8_LOALO|nr:hypothetical protein LOAG_14929 [Loa loa]EFO13599.1 hypothetical protein LOAG_14929 [Loa loa]